jgi:ATP-dependent Clp protease adaptor protein ClpS
MGCGKLEIKMTFRILLQAGREKDDSGENTPEEGLPETGAAVLDEVELREPPRHVVLLHNDDYTTMEFVIHVLERFFRKTPQEALQITLQVHQNGKGVAGIYTPEIAATKDEQVEVHARSNGFPLKASAEPA